MKTLVRMMAFVLAGCACAANAMQALPATQGFRAEGSTVDLYAERTAADAPDAKQYADGKKAIHENRWADAVKIFDGVVTGGGDHAAGALYWKAYAENKLGQPDKAFDACMELRMQFVDSNWIDDCGALEIEIRTSKGQQVQPKPDESDELKLLALSTMVQKNPTKARAQIQEIIDGDSSEKLKEGAIFILGELTPEAEYPEIVRISYLEGDVRVARAAENEKSKTPVWESAVMNLPVQPGDTIVTGKDGRAEIEFEDASTIYLGEESVLNCQDMHTLSGVPHTELALVSGTVTMHLDSLMPGETFLMRSPTNDLLTRYPQKADLRVTSYVDGVSVASLKGGSLGLPVTGRQELAPGQTVFFNEAHHIAPLDKGKTEDYSTWDAWVADRFAARSTAMNDVMKEAGVNTPLPGLAEMKGQGTFFDCPPFGRCWEPAGGKGNSLLVAAQAPAPTPKSAKPSSGGPTNGSNGNTPYPQEFFPCFPSSFLYMNPGYYASAQQAMWLASSYDPYEWAICHTGTWIRHNGRYAWVVGTKRHHHPPVHWVKNGKTVAIVPLHPKDVKGKPPLNVEHGFAPLHEKDGKHLAAVKFDPTHPVELMKAPPREFRNETAPVLAKTGAPRLEGQSVKDVAKVGAPRAGIPLNFDHHSQGFSTVHSVMQGGHSVAVSAPLGHVGSGSSGGHSGGYSGGGGGGNHGGGGSTGGGGGSSHGGGATSTASSSSISVSSGASSSASSGSHH